MEKNTSHSKNLFLDIHNVNQELKFSCWFAILIFIFSCSDDKIQKKKAVTQNKKQEIRKEFLKKRKENFKIKYEYPPMREVKSEKRKALEKDMKRRGYCNAC